MGGLLRIRLIRVLLVGVGLKKHLLVVLEQREHDMGLKLPSISGGLFLFLRMVARGIRVNCFPVFLLVKQFFDLRGKLYVEVLDLLCLLVS